MPTNLDKFKTLLEELFMFDRADLDFGIYRIMNVKRDEIRRFLDNDLLPQVKDSLVQLETDDRAALKTELDKALDGAKAIGVDPQVSPRVKELQALYESGTDVTRIENEVFSDLTTFFRRYYSEGDFLSLRRYKEGVFAIPYEGEEVKLHWANADQYYIKSNEYFRNYAFKLPGGKSVHFRIMAAVTESNDNKPIAGQERRFKLLENDPVSEEHHDLVIRFEYKPDPKKRTREQLNELAAQQIMALPGFTSWKLALGQLMPTNKNTNRTLLDKHLAEYTARNTFDYFIHKNLGRFLRRELDFFIKNEVMHLDDIEAESAPRAEQYLAKIKAIRRIAHKIIEFLAQLEDFQKKLWLKKKFVVETNYCITLDRVPEELYPEIVANDFQREEWVKLFAIEDIKGDLINPGYSNPLKIGFLKSNPYLVLDTRHFTNGFLERLLRSISNLEDNVQGILIESENYHALQLLMNRFRGQIGSVYIDPPYNTGSGDFVYKDNYQSSTWMSMALSRAVLALELLKDDGLMFVQIGDDEAAHSRLVLEAAFPARKNTVVVRRGIKNVQAQFEDIDKLSLGHDLIHVLAKNPVSRLPHLRQSLESEKPGKWDTFWRGTDRETMRYELFGQTPETGQWRWEEVRANLAKKNFSNYLRHESQVKSLDEWYIENLQAGADLDFVRKNEEDVVQYYVPPQGFRLISDNWLDIPAAGNLTDFPHEKSIALLQRIISWNTKPGEFVLDFFAGSGTTGHAAFASPFLGDKSRRYILIEVAQYCETLMRPRIKRAIYSDDWRENKPVSRKGISQMFKYIRLESYEDTINNLQLKRTDDQEELLIGQKHLREDYMLNYILDVESRDSASLLNLKWFDDPFNYKLDIVTGDVGELKPVIVDLVETFNYLLGLRVKHIDTIRGYKVVQGENPDGDKVLVIWRNAKEKLNDELDEFFVKQKYNTKDNEFDLIYVNGDNNLENLRRPDEKWKVRVTEYEFKRLMFEEAEN